MGQLQIISVTGAMPHTACFFDYTATTYADGWMGFAPEIHRTSGWPRATPGKIYKDDESHRINHGILFELPDSRLLAAANAVVSQYTGRGYKVGVCDCVSFSADVARECGLRVPLVNMTPYGLIEILAVWNTYVRLW